MKIYEVTVTSKYPPVGETPGIIEVFAKDTNDAKKKTRKEMEQNGYTRQDGPMIFSVKVKD